MKKIFLGLITVMLLSSFVSASPDTGRCVQQLKDLTILLLDSPNDEEGGKLGDAISDGFFGNEPNLLNTNTDDDLGPNEVEPGSSAGHVVPSLSPGPKTVGGNFITWGSLKRNDGIGSVSSICSS